ncbi:MAG: glycoside hydrolase family 9 protein [Ruminococcus sp.]|nr:glycoside hydrolase family 9 protein [Ruminococcus sp.]
MKNLAKLSKKLTAAAASAVMALTSAASIQPVTAVAADNNYYEALAMSLYMYDANACGSGITDGPLNWRGDCHTYDAQASVGDLDGSLKSAVDPDGDGKVDVSGGFHDAGDHIKFNLTIGFGINSLALSDYLNPDVYEKAGCRDHLIYELKWGADYLMKTTFLDSSGNVAAVAHVVANGGEDHAIWSSPETQTYKRPIYWLTAGKNNSAVCCEMAAGLAGTAYVLKDTDPQYADKCIKYAKALLAFGQKNVGNEGGGLADFYGTEAQYQDEEAMAQAWLWLCKAGDKPTRVPKNKDYGNSQYDGWVYCWNKVWQGYSALMYKATGDQAFADELKVELQSQGDLKVGTYNADGWGASRYNCAKQMDAIALANGDKDADYAKAAKYQMDHILGDNSLGYSFLLGYGDKWPVHIHHRAANPGTDANGASSNPSAKYTAYGLLVGGDDKSGYQDQTDKYQYTEGALDYNGCFAIACAGIANLYGGDATAMPALAKKADEINENFKFGSSSSVVTTTSDNGTVPTTTTSNGNGNATTTTTATTTKPLVTITMIPHAELVEVISYPTKTAYTVGEDLDLSGISVKVRTQTYWQEVDGTRAGIIYGEPKVFDNITLSPEDVNVYGDNGAYWRGKDAKTLRAGSYMIMTSNDIYIDGFMMPVSFSNYKQPIYVKEAAVTTTATTTSTVTTTTTYLDGSDFEMSINRERIAVGDKAVLTFTKGANLVQFGNLSYDDNVISLTKKTDSTYEITGLKEGSARIVFIAPTGASKAVTITVGTGIVFGDANCDDLVDLSDVVLIMQSLANPNKYGLNGSDKSHITEFGLSNADVNMQGGVTGEDALYIQKYLLKLITELPIPVVG